MTIMAMTCDEAEFFINNWLEHCAQLVDALLEKNSIGHRMDRDDIVSRTMEKLIRCDEVRKPESLLYVTVRNLIIDEARKLKRRSETGFVNSADWDRKIRSAESIVREREY